MTTRERPRIQRCVDLNADLGEGFGVWRLTDDAALLDVVSTANVACGFHAGDPSVMARVCRLAAERGVRVGAHVGYRDLAGFGRRAMSVSASTVRDEVMYQVGALAAIAQAHGLAISHVKPHGALYHAAVADPRLADAVVAATQVVSAGVAVIGPPGGELASACQGAGVTYVTEGFADRRYTDDGALVPRTAAEAVHGSPEASSRQAVALAGGEPFPSVSGHEVVLAVRTICLHGDSPSALEHGRRTRVALEAAGYAIRSAVG